MSEIQVGQINSTDGSTAITTGAGGTVTLSAALTAGGALAMGANNISFSNGNGIDFSASEGSGATSSVLDDYEEGTFTPTLIADTNPTGVVYNAQVGRYTKVGNMVHIEITVQLSNKGSGGSGNAYIGGLPFTSVSVSSHYPNFGIALGPVSSAKAGYATGQVTTGETRITLVYNNNTTSGLAGYLLSDITNSTAFRTSFSYEV